MSKFDDTFDTLAVPALVDHNGHVCTYVEPNGSETELAALVTAEQSIDQSTEHGRKWVRTRWVTYQLSLFASPTKQGRIRLAGSAELWAVEGIDAQTSNLVRLQITRPERSEVTRPAYRSGG